MGDKAQGSRPVTPTPRLWNRVVDSTVRHEQQLRLGKGKPPQPFSIDKNIIKCKNGVGTNLTRGSVVDVDDYTLTGLSAYEPATLWFDGVEPAGGHYAVFRGAVPDGEYGDAQLTGVCIARVNITDANHNFATPTSGETYFTSATSGEIQILDKASSGTGVKECVVVLRCGGGASLPPLWCHAAEAIAGYNDTDGYTLGDFTPHNVTLNGSSDPVVDYPSALATVEAYNISSFNLKSGEGAFLFPNGSNGNYLAFPIGRNIYHLFNVTAVSLTTTPTAFTLTSQTNSNHVFAEISSGDIRFLVRGYYDVRVQVEYLATKAQFTVAPDWAGGSVGALHGYQIGPTINSPEHPAASGGGFYEYNFAVSVDAVNETLRFTGSYFSGGTSAYIDKLSVIVTPRFDLFGPNGTPI